MFVIELLIDYLNIEVTLTIPIRIVISLVWPWGLVYIILVYCKERKKNK